MPEEILKASSGPGQGGDDRVECCCPPVVVYIIFTKCLTVSNGACQDWSFCEPGCDGPMTTVSAA